MHAAPQARGGGRAWRPSCVCKSCCSRCSSVMLPMPCRWSLLAASPATPSAASSSVDSAAATASMSSSGAWSAWRGAGQGVPVAGRSAGGVASMGRCGSELGVYPGSTSHCTHCRGTLGPSSTDAWMASGQRWASVSRTHSSMREGRTVKPAPRRAPSTSEGGSSSSSASARAWRVVSVVRATCWLWIPEIRPASSDDVSSAWVRPKRTWTSPNEGSWPRNPRRTQSTSDRVRSEALGRPRSSSKKLWSSGSSS
mmetsp:Transcript_30159/g.85009  ORF Transcript_30159/g.85009 Transcript_30159/m.85009 type:complete len:254 (+) Transcript_30159:186-947(+)